MKKAMHIMLGALLILSLSCGKSGDRRAGESGSPEAKSHPGQTSDSGRSAAEPGSKPGGGEEIDVDKLNIPDQIKEAIKSGRIPKDQIPAILERFQGNAQGESVPVNVTTVRRMDLNSYLILNGIVEPERKVEVFSRLSAYVKQIVKEEGSIVQENDVLALLDDTEIKISYEQAKIMLDQAKLSLDEAEANFTRSQELKKKELISEQEHQTTQATFKQRQLDYDSRIENLKNLQLQLNWTKIRALSEGFITERLIEVGDRVNANEQVFTIEDFSPLLIRVFVPTSDVVKLKVGMPAEVTTEVLKGTVFEGRVKLINPRIDAQTGTVKITVEVFDDTLHLKPGMFVETRINIGKKDNVLAIPRKAILYKQNKTFVFVVNQGQVSQREIRLGLTEEDEVEILDGLIENEIIVDVGVENLKDGDRVEVVR